MTREEYQKSERDMIALVSCAVNGAVPQETDIRAMNLPAVYAIAEKHMLSAAVAMALENAGWKDARSTKVISRAVRRAAQFEAAAKAVFQKLEEAGIWYMPLKGSVIKDFYPKIGMREMADHDILYDADRAEDVKAIMEALGFEARHFGASNHDCYYKEPILNFEMHRALFGPSHEEKLYEYYQDVQGRLIGGGCKKHLSPEDFYLYMTAHEYKHYSGGGTGLRSVLDTYVYLRNQGERLDLQYIRGESEKLGIAEFEAANRSLAIHLFSGEGLTEADQEMLDYILSSGTYGTITHRVENKMRKNGWSKIRYTLDRFFVPVSRKNIDYATYAGAYPVFYKHKILLPTLPFFRTFKAIKSGRFIAEVKAIRDAQTILTKTK